MTKYSELKKLIQQQQERQMKARAAAAAIGTEITMMETLLEIAVLDDDHAEQQRIQKEMDAKKAEMEGHGSTVRAFLKPAAELLQVQRQGKVGKLAAEVIQEGRHQLQEIQTQYDAHQQKLVELKKAYMSELEKAGSLYRDSELISAQMREASQYAPGQQNTAIGGLVTNVKRYGEGGRGQYATGPGFIDPVAAEKVYFTGRV